MPKLCVLTEEMKRLSFIIAAFCLIQISCQEDVPILFEMKYEERFEIPAGLNNITLHVFTLTDINSFYGNLLAANNATDDDVSSIQAGRGRIAGIGQEFNYGIVERLIINIVDPFGEIPKREIYYRENDIPFNASGTLNLLSSLSEIKPLASQDKFFIEMQFDFKSITNQNYDLAFDFGFVAKGN